MDKEILDDAKVLWDYHLMDNEIKKADLIFCLGSIDIRSAERSAELFLAGFAPYILFSGGLAHANDILKTAWDKAEAEVFAERAMELGVPKDKILIEDKAMNTGENITLGFEVLNAHNLKIKSMILVQKPIMVRRNYATFMKQWPGEPVEIYVTAPTISFEDYLNVDEVEQDKIINIIVGALQRIKIYPEKGFQIPQEIPDSVWDSYKKLVAKGFTKHFIKEL